MTGKDRLDAILDATSEGWITIDPAGTITGWNAAAEATFGWSAAEAVGEPLRDLIIPPSQRDAHVEGLAQHQRTGQGPLLNRRFETVGLHRDGHEVAVELTISALDHEGELSYHAFLHDVTERKRIAEIRDLQVAVSRLLATAPSLSSVLEQLPAVLGRHTGFSVVGLWTEVGTPGGLACEHWYRDDERAGDLHLAGPPSPGTAGGALIQAFASGEPVYRPRLSEDARYRDITVGHDASGLWIPLRAGARVVGVVTLLSKSPQRVPEETIDLLAGIMAQVGQVIERREVEEQIIAVSRQNQSILEGSGEGILGKDGDAIVTFANRTAASMLRTDAEQLLGRHVHDVVHGDQADHTREDCPLVLAPERATKGAAHTLLTANGTPLVVDWICCPLETGSTTGGSVLTFREVGERLALEIERERERAFLHAVLDGMDEVVVAIDARGTLNLLNRTGTELLGPAAPTETFADLAARLQITEVGTDRPRGVEDLALARALRGERVRGDESLATTASGEQRRLATNAGPILDAARRVAGAVAVLRDVTYERQVEEQLVRSDRQMAEGERLAGIGSFELDLATGDATWSEGVYLLLGLEPRSVEASSERFFAAVHPEDMERMQRSLDDLVRNGTLPEPARYRLMRADGAERVVEIRSWLVGAGAGDPTRLVGTLQDVTERVEAEASLARSQTRSRHLERMESLGQLAGGVAHDFNNLLAVILNCADFVAEDVADRPGTSSDVAEIRRAAERAADLTQRLLLFSRRDVVHPQAVDLHGLVDEVHKLLERLLGEDIEIEMDVPAELPSVHGDRSQIEQMLINFAVNARDAMPDGGRLRLEAREAEVPPDPPGELEPGLYVRLDVTDTGVGMAPSVAAHAFEPFFTTKAKGRGTGLGLATAYGAVTEAGGSITVSSTPGEGSVFSVHLPVSAEAPDAGRPPRPSGSPTGRGGLVVLAEDDEAVRRVTARILRDGGYGVIDTASGQAALEAIELCEGQVNLVLTDLVMPGLSGWQLREVVSERWPKVPILLMSGYTEDVVQYAQLVAQGVPFLSKPFSADQLLREVGALSAPSSAPDPD